MRHIHVTRLVPGRSYFLTPDFYPNAGREVTLLRFVSAREANEKLGVKSKGAIVTDRDGHEYYLHHAAVLLLNAPETINVEASQ